MKEKKSYYADFVFTTLASESKFSVCTNLSEVSSGSQKYANPWNGKSLVPESLRKDWTVNAAGG